jgi:hypothetical protein
MRGVGHVLAWGHAVFGEVVVDAVGEAPSCTVAIVVATWTATCGRSSWQVPVKWVR